ncbi:hypothetical protein EFU51_18885, partial [Vibrio cholerae]|nr:hypothetical protein [Vibrio cholerae]
IGRFMSVSILNEITDTKVINDDSIELLPAFKDPEFYLLEKHGKNQKLSILKIRRRVGCSITEAIEMFNSRSTSMQEFKNKKLKKSKKRRVPSEGVGNSVIKSLAGKTSARNWKIVK